MKNNLLSYFVFFALVFPSITSAYPTDAPRANPLHTGKDYFVAPTAATTLPDSSFFLAEKHGYPLGMKLSKNILKYARKTRDERKAFIQSYYNYWCNSYPTACGDYNAVYQTANQQGLIPIFNSPGVPTQISTYGVDLLGNTANNQNILVSNCCDTGMTPYGSSGGTVDTDTSGDTTGGDTSGGDTSGGGSGTDTTVAEGVTAFDEEGLLNNSTHYVKLTASASELKLPKASNWKFTWRGMVGTTSENKRLLSVENYIRYGVGELVLLVLSPNNTTRINLKSSEPYSTGISDSQVTNSLIIIGNNHEITYEYTASTSTMTVSVGSTQTQTKMFTWGDDVATHFFNGQNAPIYLVVEDNETTSGRDAKTVSMRLDIDGVKIFHMYPNEAKSSLVYETASGITANTIAY